MGKNEEFVQNLGQLEALITISLLKNEIENPKFVPIFKGSWKIFTIGRLSFW